MKYRSCQPDKKFEVSVFMIYRWLYNSNELSKKTQSRSISDSEYDRLLRENQALKETVAEKKTVRRCDLKSVSRMLFKKTVHQNKNG